MKKIEISEIYLWWKKSPKQYFKKKYVQTLNLNIFFYAPKY